ncbi:MAG: class I SAM-dependent methyltransferase [Myxococcota bacterium]
MSESPDDAQRAREVFFALHEGLPRQAPGHASCTASALGFVRRQREPRRVLDVGCGPGAQTVDLAQLLPRAHFTAVDLYPPFVEEARARLADAGCGDRVTVEVGDMAELPFPEASFDLVWCEGAAYILGVETALASWRPLLEDGGCVAFTDAAWLRVDPSEAARAFWETDYPSMSDVATLLRRVEAERYRVLGHFVLPASAWDAYYAPLTERTDAYAASHPHDPVVDLVLASTRREIDLYANHGDCYGYVFVIAEKA